MEIIGYHGTATKNVESILNNGFKLSTDIENEQWLGDGVYFFCDGVPPKPYWAARKWAIAEAWDNLNYTYKYRDYTILESMISLKTENFIDLTEKDGLETFNYLRDKFIQKIKESKKCITNTSVSPKDGHIINLAVQNRIIPKLDAVKGNFYIKFTDERICKANFRTPNCTVLSVRDINSIKYTKIIQRETI